MKRFECVPNFSEGRDAGKVAAIADEARAVPGVSVLDVESNADHHRSVISIAGAGDSVSEAAFRMIRKAVETIDLTVHHGEHPRMGAADVVPFVPLGEATTEEAVALAASLGERVWRELHVPVYLYADAARRPERRDLAVVRKGEFEGIRDSIGHDAARRPDFGDAAVHPTAGIVAIGARSPLIAFNAYLSTPDVTIAKHVAHSVRARDGGLAEVKALGFEIKERGRAQVSMNLTDHRKTPIHRALEAVRREAARYGASVEESEIVGLVPEDALLAAAEFYLQLNTFDRANVLERKLAIAPGSRGPGAAPLSGLSLSDFTERLAARTPTPGGGSASALAGALGAALLEMVARYSLPPSETTTDATIEAAATARTRFLVLVDEDSASFEAVRAAQKAKRDRPDDRSAVDSWIAALRTAADVPLETAKRARDLRGRVDEFRPRAKSGLLSDLLSAAALLDAAAVGALENVRINLESLSGAGDDVSGRRAELELFERSRGRTSEG